MMIEVHCEYIRRNAEIIADMCAAHGIQVVGVTKACCGHPGVARAMLAGGLGMLADSRLRNMRRLRDAGIAAPFMLLRLPCLSEVDEVVRLTQVSLNSEVETVRALSGAAQAQGVTHRVILMVETGDRREGVMPDQALETARAMLGLAGIDLVGIGTNLACVGGVLPTRDNMQLLVDVAEDIERTLGIRFQVISGGHTANLGLVERGEIPQRVNQLRIGEAILMGMDITTNRLLPYLYQGAFNVVAEVIEIKTKPSLPAGLIAVDAFGRAPCWEDLGLRRRAILSIGEQDLRTQGLRPKRPGVTIVGASSDHLVVDVTDANPPVHMGEELTFDPLYIAVATGMASAGVVQAIRPVEEVSHGG
ncbi:MAG: alanine/ornithine racemase family PLP-dependent enzyme [Chloroflexota bacterium]|nr:alanine/ornithine racemase family PLP-dependent enzyme [Chloroflexota bacterium]